METLGRILTVIGIIVNLFAPGIGTLVMGKWVSGFIQLGLLAVALILKLVSIGILGIVLGPMVWAITAVAWGWALLGGILTYLDRSWDAKGASRRR